MNQKTTRIVYLAATGLLTVLMLLSAGMYILDYQTVAETFNRLGFPTYIIYPLAIAKVLGLVAIWTKKSNTLKEWAYAGFFFNFLLALSAHINIHDGEYLPAFLAIVFLMVSFVFEKRLAQ